MSGEARQYSPANLLAKQKGRRNSQPQDDPETKGKISTSAKSNAFEQEPQQPKSVAFRLAAVVESPCKR